jgi:2-keto-4-pentenoate hydratase/2-oxohepta-3-ene-1,7-dioic acid hydratase in catechol pathway
VKIVHFSGAGRLGYGVLDGRTIRTLAGSPYGRPRHTGLQYRLDDVRLLAPCRPSKIVALGVNYRSHGEEMSHRIPAEPLIFIKPPTAVIGPEDGIVYPEMSERVDYEGELGVVIGKRASHVAEKDAARYIMGYTCCNDVTARDIQARDKQWTRAKGFDTFAPIGPWIETELDPSNLHLETRLNGEVRQSTSTGELIFGVHALVSFISRIMTLLPGDVIATGTPSGIGPMQPGDTVEVEIEKIGTLRNHVVLPGDVRKA